ncbi:RPII140-upstream gene protein [Gryllus bimaculatus]|nr:RPII140-upstream gene protein [Gryllus bimaculatus]
MLWKTRLFGVKCVLCGLLPFQISSDNGKQSEKSASMFDRERYALTGRERLYRMFSMDEGGSFSPELIRSYQATVFGAFVGATYGGYRSTKQSPEVKQQSNALALKEKVHGRNLSPDGQEIVVNFIKGGFRWAWRVGLLCGSLTLLTTAVSEYRGHSGILEYSVAGAVLGPWLGWKSGVRLMAMGGVLGIVIGTAGGCVMYAAHTVGGTTTEETYFWQHGYKETQLKHSKDRLKKLKEESRVFLESNGEGLDNSTNSNKASNQ